jgi:hypothetical protein
MGTMSVGDLLDDRKPKPAPGLRKGTMRIGEEEKHGRA